MMILRRLLLLPLFVITASAVRADDVDRLITQGIDQMYAVDFDGAARTFDQAIAANRLDPRGYFYRANVHLWSYVFDKQQSQLDLFFSLNDKAIAVANARIDAAPADARAKLFLGMAYGYKTIANARAENFMAAALSARTCYETLNEVIRSDPKAYDAYLGLGLFHFLFGSVPKAGQVIAGLNGIKGDAKLGIREIETVASRGVYFRNDAQLIVSLIRIYYLNELATGVAALEGLARRYPKNVGMSYAIGTAYQMQNLPDRAIPYFERVIQGGNEDFKFITDLSLVRTGAAYVAKNDPARAKPFLQRFLKQSNDKVFRTYGWYLLGLVFDLQGSHDNAVKSYTYAVNGSSPTPEDRMGKRRSALLIKQPMTDMDRAVQRAVNAASASHWDEAISLANGVLSGTLLLPAQRAQAAFALAVGLQGKGDYARAIDTYKAAIATGRHSETWVAPYGYLHIAECYLKLGQKEKWRANVDMARTFSGYDNETQLRFLIERDVTMID